MVRDRQPQQPQVDVDIDVDTHMGGVGSAPSVEGTGPGMGVLREAIRWGLAGAVTLIVLFLATDHHDPQANPRRPLASHCTGVRCETTHAPSQAVVAAFAQHLPGSIVVSEHTVKGRVDGRGLAVRQRIVNAVSGNVDIKVTIAPASARIPRPARPIDRVANDGYVVDFSFAGFYPPTRARLRALGGDSRLISVGS